MRIACVYIKHFMAMVDIRDNPELASQPIVIGGLPHERKLVCDCSPEAAGHGIMPGLSLREAHHLSPEAVFLPLDESKYNRAFEDVLVLLDRFSPAVELDSPGTAFMDVTGLGDVFGGEEIFGYRLACEVSSRAGFCPRIGLGNSKYVADVAARLCSARDTSVVAEGDERNFLNPMPVELLPLSEETKRRLKLLGFHTLGQISALPADALASQFGKEGLLAHELACGVDRRPVVPRTRPAILEDGLSVVSPLETVEALSVAVSLLLDRLQPKLWARGQVCGEIKLRFHSDGDRVWHESLRLKTPTPSKQEILDRIRHRLETLRFPGGVSAVYLALARSGSEPAGQGTLLGSHRGKLERRIEGVARHLKARFGKAPLKKVVPLDPCSRIPERRAALIDFPKTDD